MGSTSHPSFVGQTTLTSLVRGTAEWSCLWSWSHPSCTAGPSPRSQPTQRESAHCRGADPTMRTAMLQQRSDPTFSTLQSLMDMVVLSVLNTAVNTCRITYCSGSREGRRTSRRCLMQPSLKSTTLLPGLGPQMEKVCKSFATCQYVNFYFCPLTVLFPDCTTANKSPGTTATVALLHDNVKLHIGHVGDSRAILCRRGLANRLTSDHCPSLLAEKV